LSDLLFLSQRIPYPPNKGDKIRSFYILRHLAQRHRVHLGCFVDDPEDWQHVEALREFCVDTHIARLDPQKAKIRSGSSGPPSEGSKCANSLNKTGPLLGGHSSRPPQKMIRPRNPDP